jgi:hypothetical protein
VPTSAFALLQADSLVPLQAGLLAPLQAEILMPLQAEILPPPSEVRRALDQVLARAEFQPHEPTWLERLQSKAQEVFMDLLKSILGSAADNPGVVRTILLVALGLAALSVVIWIWRAWQPRSEVSSAAVGSAPDVHAHPDLEAQLDGVRRALADGDYEGAMHALYRATWLSLAQRRLVRTDADQTAGDLARALGAKAEAGPFRRLARSFEPVAYGGRAGTRAGFDGMRACADELGVPT